MIPNIGLPLDYKYNPKNLLYAADKDELTYLTITDDEYNTKTFFTSSAYLYPRTTPGRPHFHARTRESKDIAKNKLHN